MSKVISIETKLKDKCYEIVSEMLDALPDYDIEVKVRPVEVKIILQELYNLYKEKNIIYQYVTDMSTYFNEIMNLAIDEDIDITSDFIFTGLTFCQYLQTPIEIEKTDMTSALQKAKIKMLKIGGL